MKKQLLTKTLALALLLLAQVGGAKAEVTDTYISTTKLWTFSDKTTAALGSDMEDWDGLIYRGGTSNTIAGQSASGKMGAYSFSTTKCAKIQGNIAAVSGATGQRLACNSGSLPRNLAFNVSVPGTCYVYMTSNTDNDTDMRYRKILFNRKADDNTWGYDEASVRATSGSASVLSLHGDREGTFWIGGTLAVNVYAVLFVPDSEASAFGFDSSIKSTTVWTFDQYQANDIIAINSTATNYGGLYIKGHGDDTNQSIAKYAERTVTFGDYTVKSNYYYEAKGGKNGTITSAWLNGKTASDVSQDIMAFNAEVAGTAYVAISSSTGTGRTNDLFFSPLDGTYEDNSPYHYSVTADGTIQILTLTNTKAGTYFFSASGGYSIYGVRFVPTVASTETKTITMSDMGVMTFSSPQGWSLPSGLQAYTATTSKSDVTLTLTAVPDGIIPPCTGVILQGTHNTEYTLTASDAAQVTINKNNCFRPVLCDYALTGEYRYGTENGSSTSWNASRNNYILAKQGGDMVFALSDGTGKVVAGKAYYSIRPDLVNYPSAAPFFTLDFSNAEMTDIKKIYDLPIGNLPIFNLSGQRVAAPTKGLYIVNGKKVVMK